MANQEHLDILKQGVEVWNEWRKQHPQIEPDLSGAQLDRINLSFVDLSFANLKDAFFSDTNLSNANLRDTDLSNAYFGFADLSFVDLSFANLYNADLGFAKINGAVLEGTDFTQAQLLQTLFTDVDLKEARGLEAVQHNGPSSIGLDTLYYSQGQISALFLQGIGVPEQIIENVHTLIGTLKLIDYSTCFISYSSLDQKFAERLYTDLQARGVRCWFAPEDLKIGDHYHQRIDESIRLYDKLILILSENALASAWVEREVAAAREKEDRSGQLVLFPVRLDDTILETQKAWAADVRRRWHIGDFTRWKEHDEYQKAFNRLLRDLKAETK